MEGLGERLRRLRKGKGMSLRGLGEKVHLSHTYIADIEKGRSTPSVDTLASLAEALDVPIAELITESDEPPATGITKQIMELIANLPRKEQEELVKYAQYLHVKQFFEGGKKESSSTSEVTA